MLYLLLATLSVPLPSLQPCLSPLVALHFSPFISPALLLIALTPRKKKKKNLHSTFTVCFAISITLFRHFPHHLLPRSDFTYFNPITYFFSISSLCPLPPMQVDLFIGSLSALFSSTA